MARVLRRRRDQQRCRPSSVGRAARALGHDQARSAVVGWGVTFVRELRRRLFARFYDRVQANYEVLLAQRKDALFVDVSGTVVEIGPGTGANLPHLPRGLRWIGVEPNP